MVTQFILILRPDFHFGPFEGIPVSFPVEPADTTPRTLSACHVSAIQISVGTGVIPPGTSPFPGTMTTVGILLPVLSRELLTIVIGKAVTWKHTDWPYYSEIINQTYQVVN